MWRLMTPDSSFKDSCLKEEQSNWALAGDGPGVKGDVACVCGQCDCSRGRQTLILCRRTWSSTEAFKTIKQVPFISVCVGQMQR